MRLQRNGCSYMLAKFARRNIASEIGQGNQWEIWKGKPHCPTPPRGSIYLGALFSSMTPTPLLLARVGTPGTWRFEHPAPASPEQSTVFRVTFVSVDPFLSPDLPIYMHLLSLSSAVFSQTDATD
ncbi:unnamed protein product, partial [Ectocarpus sp. 12 AP-2014]